MKSKGIVIRSQLSKSKRSINFQLKDDWHWYYAPLSKNKNISMGTDLTKISTLIKIEWDDNSLGRWRKVTSIVFENKKGLKKEETKWTVQKLKDVRNYCKEYNIEEVKKKNKPFFREPKTGHLIRARTFYERYIIARNNNETRIPQSKPVYNLAKNNKDKGLSREQVNKAIKWSLINNYEVIRKNNVIYIKVDKGYKTIDVAYKQNKDEIDSTK